ncbi:hypothetical protein V8G54_009742 [Vigna mungo]|uniref:Uncharacterized protein n=1 Tax=Vigna mungo TaxID=3915 RepID=A0AAQ3NVS0_VIGMU
MVTLSGLIFLICISWNRASASLLFLAWTQPLMIAFQGTTLFSGILYKSSRATSRKPNLAYPKTIVVHETSVFCAILSNRIRAANRSPHLTYMSISALLSGIVNSMPCSVT